MNEFSIENHEEGMWWSQPMMNTPQRIIPSSNYKNVIPQANGRWGAQIYNNHHQVWLGTFDTQEAATHSYNQATSMFRDTAEPPECKTQELINEEEEEEIEQQIHDREQMFEKPLTPSDVGKLNRLVIPKQHAEKYFPLNGNGTDSVEKGLLLSFEDELRKIWRFRYSYWNSSQSYVLTKGWSRFVKEKQLDAGDVVSFERQRLDGQQLYIRWRRRVVPPVVQDRSSRSLVLQSVTAAPPTTSSSAWTRVYYSAQHPYPSHHLHHGPLLYQPQCLHANVEPVVQNTVANVNKKRVRLFGVNLDCQLDEPDPPGQDGSSFSSQDRAHFLYSQGNDFNQSIHKEFNFSGEFNQARNGPGDGDMSI